jgi:hypothetical protein
MSRTLALASTLLLISACSGGANDTDGTNDTDAESSACDEVTAGDDWAWSGSCIGMTMGCEIVRDGCELTITCSGMDMGLPEGAMVDGSAVTFDDGDSVTGCEGTVEDANTLSGTCDGECSWTLER